MSDQHRLRCSLCGGKTVKGIVLDHDYEQDYQSAFIVEGDAQGLVLMSYPNQLPITVRACITCGHLSNFVDSTRLRERLQALGHLDDLERGEDI